MHPVRLTLLLPLAALGAVLAKPLVLPTPEAKRLDVLFFGTPTAQSPGHDPITRYRAIKRNLGSVGIDFTYSEDPAEVLKPETLKKYDAVLMYGNWAQNGPMPADQLKALTDYVEEGGAFLPIHAASACYGGSPEFIKLVGGRFRSHGGEVFKVTNTNPEHPIMQGYGGYSAWDESYVHDNHGDDRVILEKRQEEPWTWVREQGKGRVFYTAAGHDHRVWDLPEFHDFIKRAVYWSVGPEKYGKLAALKLPEYKEQDVQLPSYETRQLITKAQAPLPAEESMKLAQVPAGFELSLFANEPDIVNPIWINWDHKGRAYIIQTTDYPNNLQAGDAGNDKIILAEDTNKDGLADKFTTFADKLSIPTSLVFANGGVITTNGADMLFLQDTDGDDVADTRKVLFTGFGTGDTHAGVSNLRYGHDGWIYGTVGYSGFRGTVGGEQINFSQSVFRFLPDGSKLENIQSTTNNTWGLGTTSAFEILGSTANGNPSFYVTFPQAVYASGGLTAPRTPRADDPPNPFFNPSSTDIRQVDQHGRYTAAAGHAIYTAERFPEQWREKAAFVTEATGKLVGTFTLTSHGGGFKAKQEYNNIYNSADAWSGPVAAEVGPDGALWICDWYNLIIQHNPTPNVQGTGLNAQNGKGNAYESPYRDKSRGRVYRIYPTGTQDDTNPGLDPAKPETLIAGLNHSNLFWRLHAQRLIVESGDKELVAKLKAAAASDARGSSHAVYALAGLGALDAEAAGAALKSSIRETQRAAILVAKPEEIRDALIVDGTLKIANDRDLADALVSLSRLPEDAELGKALFNLLTKEEPRILSDVTLKDAWQIAANRHPASVTAAATAAKHPSVVGLPPVPNLLPNPTFSEVVNGTPVGWSDVRTYTGSKDTVKVTSVAEGRSGTPALSISSTATADVGVAVTVSVKPRTQYRLSGWIKTIDHKTSGNSTGAMLNIHGGERTNAVKDTSDWTRVSAEFNSGDNTQVVVHSLFGGYGGGTGTALFDDVSLSEIPGGEGVTGILASLAAKAGPGAAEETAERKFAPNADVHKRGEEIYNLTCVACHQPTGTGLEGAFPPLDGSDWATGDPTVPIRVVTGGLQGPVKVLDHEYNSVMPAHTDLDDQKVADVITFVRQSWSNDASPVTASQVKEIRDKYKDRTDPWTAAELGR